MVYVENLIISKAAAIYLSIVTVLRGEITIHKYLEISRSLALKAITAQKITLKEEVLLNFTSNKLNDVFYSSINDDLAIIKVWNQHETHPLKECFVQYTSNQGNLDKKIKANKPLNCSILFLRNDIKKFNDDKMAHCSWENGSAFINSPPFHIMKKVVHFIGN